MFFMALCTSSLDAETPRCAYLFEVSELMKLLLLCAAKIIIFFWFCLSGFHKRFVKILFAPFSYLHKNACQFLTSIFM
jgi:hypothetical protein